MCGICGIAIPERHQRAVNEAELIRMRDTLVHRGPDGAGIMVDHNIGLGHRRLSIMDVAHGAQPMTTPDGQITIVYNGEVFNHPQLKQELEQTGVTYRTTCDTETVLHLYRAEGNAGVRRCRGMFAWAIWDRTHQRLTLTRDRFGVKPLYYSLLPDGTLLFASEIKALLEHHALSASLNHLALPDFLANHAPSGTDTLFRNVKRLAPGHQLVWRDGQITIERYWDLSFTRDRRFDGMSDAAIVDEYESRLSEAVRLRLMSDVPLGMFLSGGIDSAAITALMSRMVSDPIKTFSVAFAEREANELRYAQLVADRYRTDHRTITVSPTDFWNALPTLLWHEDEPLAHPSSVALNFVSRLAAEHVKVVLSGEGSDETLAGYNRYRVTIANMALGGAWEAAVPAAIRRRLSSAIGDTGTPGLRGKLARTFLARPASLDAIYFDNFAVFAPHRIASLLTDSAMDATEGAEAYAAYHDALRESNAETLLGKLLYTDTRTYLHELLMKQDQMSMAASIESRVPFLDHELAQFVSSLPDRMKLRGATTKWILRQAMRDKLPAEILSRKKMGFPVPVGSWLRGEWRHLLDEFVLSDRVADRGVFRRTTVSRMVQGHLAGENHSERLWALITFELWQRIFIDGEDPSTVTMTPTARRIAMASPATLSTTL
jgi:asparagine synthase (glutamine-hydrolysing)